MNKKIKLIKEEAEKMVILIEILKMLNKMS